MSDELIAEFGLLLLDPIDQIKPSLMSTVRDCEDPHSGRKIECTEIRCRMMKRLVELGYGEYSVLNLVNAAIGAHHESDSPAPKSISTDAAAASKAAFWAIMTRDELLKPGGGNRVFDRQLNVVVLQADAVLGDPKSTYEIDSLGDGLLEAIQKLSGKRRSEEALQTGAKKKQEDEAPLIEARNKYIRELGMVVTSEPGHHSRVAGKVAARYNKSDYKNYPPYKPLTSKTVRSILRCPTPIIPPA